MNGIVVLKCMTAIHRNKDCCTICNRWTFSQLIYYSETYRHNKSEHLHPNTANQSTYIQT